MTQRTTDLVGALPPTRPLTDLADLALALGGDITSFTGQLLLLVAKADPGNRDRLRVGFPREVRAWELWMRLAPDVTAGQLQQRLDAYMELIGQTLEQLQSIRTMHAAFREAFGL